ncbi:MAG: vWA domain-containing protein [Pirellulales bacterium]
MTLLISAGRLLPSRLILLAQVTDSESSQSIEYVLDAGRPLAVWLMVLIGIAIALGVLSLYFTERGSASRLLRLIQASVRISLILLVCWMLAGWQWLRFRSDRPDLLIVLDRSASMQTADMPSAESIHSDAPETRLRAALHHLDRRMTRDGESLKQRYRVRFWSIAEGLTPIGDNLDAWPTIRSEPAADGPESRLGDSLQRLAQLQTGNATAAIIMATDGVVTGGTGLDDAAERLRKSGIPVFALAVGSISPTPDIQLIDALADDMVFLGDRVSVEASVSAIDAAKQPVTVRLLDAADGRVLDNRSIELTSDRPQDSVTLAFTPERAGPMNLKIEAVPLASEKNTSNNTLEQVIEVRDQTLRVLLVHKTPSFEFRFLKTMLERSEQRSGSGEKAFELSAVLQDADAEHVLQDPTSLRLVPGDREVIGRFDCFVLGNLDPALVPRSTQQMIVDQVLEQGAGLIFICDPAFDARKFANSPLQSLFPFAVSNESPHTVLTGDTAFRWQPTALGKSCLPLQLESGNDAARFCGNCCPVRNGC